MKQRPIIFNAEMVRAILDGRKTQTRRVVANVRPDNCVVLRKPTKAKAGIHTHVLDAVKHDLCPFGKVGDRLWVRECHAFVPEPAYRRSTGIVQTVNPDDAYQASIYRENFDRCSGGIKWRPSIHMPRWACRILLEIIEVRVELLNNISEADAMAEGMDDGTSEPAISTGWFEKPQRAFRRLWEQLYGEDSWASNPWVWVIKFKPLEGGESCTTTPTTP